MSKKRISNRDVVAKATQEMSELHAQSSVSKDDQRSTAENPVEQEVESVPKPQKTPSRKDLKPKPRQKEPSQPQKKVLKNRGITLPAELDALLNKVAFKRKMEQGGREGVSGIIVNLIKRHQKELEDELNK
jgi:hypothetical protein